MADKKTCSAQEQRRARETMDYWAKNRCMENVYASELAFSLIYNNIKPSRLSQALATMGLACLPDVLLLIQVDDYRSRYSKMEVTREHLVKEGIRSLLQDSVCRSGYAGFAANLIGLDTLVCFLCMPGEKAQEEELEDLRGFAAHLGDEIGRLMEISVTICIGDPCHKLSDFSKAYTRARDALYGSFYMGKDVAVMSSQAEKPQDQYEEIFQAFDCYPVLCVTISNGDEGRFQELLKDLHLFMYEKKIMPQQFKSLHINLIYAMKDYCVGCGLKDGKQLSQITEHMIDLMTRCGYAEDMSRYIMEYYRFLVQELQKLPKRTQAEAFREPICAYIKNHYGERITLKEIAEMTGYSTYYTTRIFKKYFGCTLTEYLMQFRIGQSKRMLRDQADTVGDIAVKCGFESVNYFNSCFHRYTDMSPTQYRRTFGSKAADGAGEREEHTDVRCESCQYFTKLEK